MPKSQMPPQVLNAKQVGRTGNSGSRENQRRGALVRSVPSPRNGKPLCKRKKTNALPSSEFIGVFRCGYFNVDVFLDWEDRGGSFYFVPDEKSKPRIRIGMDYNDWFDVVSVVMHEALEFLMANETCRYTHCGPFGKNHAEYMFIFDHQQFTRITDGAAFFVSKVLPVLAKKYNIRSKK